MLKSPIVMTRKRTTMSPSNVPHVYCRIIARPEQYTARHGAADTSEGRVRSWRLVLANLLVTSDIP